MKLADLYIIYAYEIFTYIKLNKPEQFILDCYLSGINKYKEKSSSY